MIRERFYEIDKSAYLFPDPLSSSDKRKQLEEPVRQWCAFELHATLTFLLEGSQGINSLDLLLLRLNVALTEYGMHQDADKPFPAVPPQLHRVLRDFFDATLAIHLNTRLPDSLDRILVADMKDYCQRAWEHLEDD